MRHTLAFMVALAGCASTAREVKLGPEARSRAEQVVLESFSSPDAEVRLRATRVAAQAALPAFDRAMPPRLADPDLRVRAVAAATLAPQSEVARQALDALLDDKDANVRLVAMEGIGAASDGLAALKMLLGDEDARVRARVADQLSTWQPAGSSAWAFCEGALRKLAADADPSVRAAAVRAAGQIGRRALLDLVERGLADAALPARLAALPALARLDHENAARFVTLASSQDRFVTLRAAVQLSHMGKSVPAREAVKAALTDRRAEVRAAALAAASVLGAEGAELAQPLLRDPDLEVRLGAARVLAHAGRPEAARRVFTAALEGPAALEAADALARLGDATGRDRLLAAYRGKEAGLRRTAFGLLSPLPGSNALFIEALADADPHIRLSAAEQLIRRYYR